MRSLLTSLRATMRESGTVPNQMPMSKALSVRLTERSVSSS
ncbi:MULTISPECIES: hypothetical protein [Ralstonia]|jgi:hypothetical protein|nr:MULTISPECIES: hypothetical protein [Ralstonia]